MDQKLCKKCGKPVKKEFIYCRDCFGNIGTRHRVESNSTSIILRLLLIGLIAFFIMDPPQQLQRYMSPFNLFVLFLISSVIVGSIVEKVSANNVAGIVASLLIISFYLMYVDYQNKANEPMIDFDDLILEIHIKVNNQRQGHGLGRLEYEKLLEDIAKSHSIDMALNGYFDHIDPRGKGLNDRYSKFGYVCTVPRGQGFIVGGAENLFQHNIIDKQFYLSAGSLPRISIYPTEYNDKEKLASDIVNGWMESPDHRKNILTDYWSKHGVGISMDDSGNLFITQNFC